MKLAKSELIILAQCVAFTLGEIKKETKNHDAEIAISRLNILGDKLTAEIEKESKSKKGGKKDVFKK